MKKSHFRILSLVSAIFSLSTATVEALPATTLVKDWSPISIMESSFNSSRILGTLNSNLLNPKKLQLLGFGSMQLQISSSMTLKFDYAALEYKKIRNPERTMPGKSKGFRLGFLVRF